MKAAAASDRFGSESEIPTRVGMNYQGREYVQNSHLDRQQQRELGRIFGSNQLAYVACMKAFSDNLYSKSLRKVTFDGRDETIISYRKIIPHITEAELTKLREEFKRVRIAYNRAIMGVADRGDFQAICQKKVEELEDWKRAHCV